MAVPMPSREPEGEVFDFDKAELANFEVWDRVVSAPAGKGENVAFVSVRIGGAVGINKGAREMLGWARAVKVLFDPKNRRLGILPAHPDDENSYRFGHSQAQLSCKKLFDYYGFRITKSKRYHDLRMIDGIMVVDL